MWLLRVQRLGPVLIQGRCSPPAYTGCEVVRGQGGAQVAALGTPDLLPGSWVPLLPIPGRHRRQRGRPALEGRVSGGSRTFSGGWCLLSSEPAPPLRNLRWCQVPVAIVSTDLHDGRAWTGRAQVTGAPQLHLEEPQPPRILLLKQQSGWEWSGCWGGVCVSGGGGSYGDPLQQPWCKPGSSWSPEEGSPPPSQVRKQRLREAGCRDAAGI